MATEEPTPCAGAVGWELGIRRTMPVALHHVWASLVGDATPVWLGTGDDLDLTPGTRYTAADGTHGHVLDCTPHRRLRLTWQPVGWDHDSTVQLTLLPAATGTTVAVHQERLTGPDERAAMLAHWRSTLDRLEDTLTA